MDSGLASLALIARIHQLAADVDTLEVQFSRAGGSAGLVEILRAAQSLGMKARQVNLQPEELEGKVLPVIAQDAEEEYFVVARRETSAEDGASRFLIQRPRQPKPEVVTQEELRKCWSGSVILLSPESAGIWNGEGGFSLRWFFPAFVKYRKLFAEVIVASFFLQIVALVTPLFFQVVMDKVLVHRGFMTLDVLAIGFAVIVIFETVIGGLRNYLLSHTCNRIDVELGARLFHHLTKLPLAYFESRQVGQTVARVRELETIRSFITGSAMTLMVDLSFTFVFVTVLWYYSPQLTWIVLGSLPFYVALSMCITPVLRLRLESKFRHGAENQAFLTESVSGIQTIKAQGLEVQMQRHWEKQLAAFVTSTFRAQNINNIAAQLAGLISKVTTLLIIWWGAHFVIAGALTVGQLVAFNMIAGRVTAPILNLVKLWQDLQQMGISINHLGDILNAPPEPGITASRSRPSSLRGAVRFKQVSFRYGQGASWVLNALDMDIQAGEVIGIVGRSGSGKSTVAKLIQRLYVPEAGSVQIDGADLALMDVSWLRSRVGIVQQESFLFNRTVRENIALANPGTSFDRVVHCAKTAGAHEFILQLPEGYDTLIDEQGNNLSGGQRQRLAIARALVTDPRILILDEATSALDYESERIVQENLESISRHRTLLIIAHRLSTVRRCDNILVIDQGVVIEQGSHEALMNANGYYAELYGYQNPPPISQSVDDGCTDHDIAM